MAGLKKSGIFLFTAILGFLLTGLILPAEFKVERSLMIEASVDKIYPHIANLRNWEHWGVWFKRDPNMVIEYQGDDGQLGMSSTWSSSSEGTGRITVINLESNKRMIYSLSFPDMGMTSTGELLLTSSELGTLVTWMDYGRVGINPIHRYFAFFMDDIVGKDFETGLENLKMISESP